MKYLVLLSLTVLVACSSSTGPSAAPPLPLYTYSGPLDTLSDESQANHDTLLGDTCSISYVRVACDTMYDSVRATLTVQGHDTTLTAHRGLFYYANYTLDFAPAHGLDQNNTAYRNWDTLTCTVSAIATSTVFGRIHATWHWLAHR